MVEKNDGEIRSRARYVTPRPRKLLQEWRTKIGNRITGGRMNLRPVDMAGEAKLTHEKLDQAARKISHGDLGPGSQIRRILMKCDRIGLVRILNSVNFGIQI
jgi:hypothetical protein